MAEDDATVRLPGDRRPDDRYATDEYDGERAFGGEFVPADPTTRFRTGSAPSTPAYLDDYGQPDYGPPPEDRTVLLGAGGWEPEPPTAPRDRLLVHVVWELLLLVLVAGLAAWCQSTEPAMFNSAGMRELAASVVVIGSLAVAVSLSLRAAVPNLAVGGAAVLAGVLFIRWIDHGAVTSLALAVGVALVGGLAVGVLVAIFHVPGWAAGLVALCGAAVAIAALTTGAASTLPGNAKVPDLDRYATWWAGGVLAISVLFGLFGMARPIRRVLGSFRPTGDPAARPAPSAAMVVSLALAVSTGIAAAAGVFGTVRSGGTQLAGIPAYTVLALGAALVGGTSAYGRRGGVFGTALGVLAVCLVLQLGAARHWPMDTTTYAVAGGAILLGLIVTRLVEWGGRARTEPLT